MKNQSIERQFQVWTAILVLIPSILIMLIFTFAQVEALRKEKQESISHRIDLQANMMEGWLSERSKDVKLLSKLDSFLDGDEAGMRMMLIAMQQECPDFDSLSFIDKNGTFQLSTLNRGINYPSAVGQPYYTAAVQGKDMISDVVIGRNSQQPIINFSAPVYDRTGKFQGLILGSVRTTTIEALLREHWIGQTGEIILVNREGVMIAEPRYANRILTREEAIRSSKMTLRLSEEARKTLLKDGSGIATWEDYLGNKVLGTYRNIPERGWTLIGSISESEVLGPIYAQVAWMAGGTMVLIFLIMPIATMLTNRIKQPLAELAEQVNQLAVTEGSTLMEPKIVTPSEGVSIGNLLERVMQANRTLREMQERYQALVQQSSSGIFVYDKGTFQVLEVNRCFAVSLGYQESEMIGMPVETFITHSVRDIQNKLAELSHKGQLSIGTRLYRHKDGSLREMDVTGAVVHYQDKQLIMVNTRDLTEKRVFEEKRRLAEAIFNFTDEAILVTGKDGCILDMNPAFIALYGYEWEELVGQKPQLLYADEASRKQVEKEVERALRTGRSWNGEIMHRKANGSVFPVWVNVNVIRDENGDAEKLVAVMTDLTCLKRAEETIVENERKYRVLFTHASDGIYTFDQETKTVLSANGRIAQMLGYTCEKLVNRPITDFVNSSHDTIDHAIAKLREDGRTFWGYDQYIRKDGTYLDVERNAAVIMDDGQELIMVNVRDISFRKRMEDQIFKDLLLAHQVQNSFLPPDIANPKLELRSIYQPHGQVSGDLFGYIWLDDGNRFFGYLLDVMGHGITAALRTTALSVIFSQAAERQESLSRRMGWINRHMGHYVADSSFMAAICFEIDFSRQSLTVASAGITYFLSSGEGLIKIPGLFLGLDEQEAFDELQLEISSGDCFYFVTDGISDGLSDQLVSELQAASFPGAVLLLNKVALTSKDDATVMAIQIR